LKKRQIKRNSLDSNTWLIINLIKETGCNPSELVRLTGNEVKKGVLVIPGKLTKNGVERSVRLSKRLLGRIRLSKALLISGREGAYSTRRVQQILKEHGLTARELRKEYLRKNPKDSGLIHIKERPEQVRVPRVKGRDGLILAVFEETGCKTGELCSLRVSDIGTEIKFPGRKIPVSSALQRALGRESKNRSSKEFLFTSRKGSLSSRRVQQILKIHDLTPGKLRKSFAVRMSGRRDITRIMGVKKVTAFTHGII